MPGIHIPHRSLHQEGFAPSYGKISKISSVCNAVVICYLISSGCKIIDQRAVNPLHPRHILQITGGICRIIPAGKGNLPLCKQSCPHIAASQGIPNGNLSGKQFIFTHENSRLIIYKYIIVPVSVGHRKLHNAFFIGAKGFVVRKRFYIREPLHDLLPAGISHTQTIDIRIGIGIAYYGETHIMSRVRSHDYPG